jgi:restriction system protein
VTICALVWIGHGAGPDLAWALFGVGACTVGLLWGHGYYRRRRASAILRDQAFYRQSEISRVDRMTGAEFEHYCAGLLKVFGYYNVVVTGSTDGDQGADVIADSPDGTPVAVQCKRLSSSVGPNVIRELIGATRSGAHNRRVPILMSSAPVTSMAQQLARAEGVEVIDRGRLQDWMCEARDELEQRDGAAIDRAVCSPGGMGVPGQVLTMVCCGALVLIILATFVVKQSKVAARPGQPLTLSASETVVNELFAAINRRDWPTVWQLSYHPTPNVRPDYRSMAAGYQLDKRDVVTSMKAAGDLVTAHVFAYETTGVVQSWNFYYKVRHGKITWGHSRLLGSQHPRQEHIATHASIAVRR